MNSEKPEVRPKKSRWWVWVLLLCVAGGVYWYYPQLVTQATSKSAEPKKSGKGGDAARAVPVVAALARKGDMPVFLDGLGSVTAFNTVTVKTRVDGEITKVAFTEG